MHLMITPGQLPLMKKTLDLYYNRAFIYRAMGRFKDADIDLKKADELGLQIDKIKNKQIKPKGYNSMNNRNISVAIIGAGASGTILAYQIIEKASQYLIQELKYILLKKMVIMGQVLPTVPLCLPIY